MISTSSYFRFLRPYVQNQWELSGFRKVAYLHFYSATSRTLGVHGGPKTRGANSEKGNVFDYGLGSKEYTISCSRHSTEERRKDREDVRQRVNELRTSNSLEYPRIRPDRRALTCSEFRSRYSVLKPEQSLDDVVTLRGRVHSSRIAGSKLVFIDVFQDGNKVQGCCDLGNLERVGVDARRFRDFYHILRRGDIISITGVPSRTKRGELTLRALELPLILTPCLASLPTTLLDVETRAQNRHADLLVNQKTSDTLKLRSHIVQHLRTFLISENFLEVQTPILANSAGGAVARPFRTRATEFVDKDLSLRIAPEIWLKRLVLGGIDRVFEIGPAFRNEGIDATHNPEFTCCEFYKSFADLEELIVMTEKLVSGLAKEIKKLVELRFTSLPTVDASYYVEPFKRIEFIPGIEAAMRHKLPDLFSKDATEQVISLFSTLSQKLPSSPTLPRLLDKLAALYLEPQCTKPTFIIHHPACLTPLGKTFLDPKTNQIISARAELFIHRREVANMYEEENSPFEQHRKFVQQTKWRNDENHAVVDESYVDALEWGLPPTGGWGCGVDRLCMMFSGVDKISDVLSFGNLRLVVGISQGFTVKKINHDENAS